MKLLILILMLSFSVSLFAKEQTTMPLSKSFLDNLWEHRESGRGEESIFTLIQSFNPNDLPKNFEIDWKLSRLCYFLGNFHEESSFTDKDIEKIFHIGVLSGKQAMEIEPNKVQGYYWYAINLGKYSLTQGNLEALRLAGDVRDALLKAASIDPSYHWGGPYRILGCLYQQLPPFISFGDKDEAKNYFEKALKLSPNFKMNLFYYAESISDELEKIKIMNAAKRKSDLDGQIEETRYKKELDTGLNRLLK